MWKKVKYLLDYSFSLLRILIMLYVVKFILMVTQYVNSYFVPLALGDIQYLGTPLVDDAVSRGESHPLCQAQNILTHQTWPQQSMGIT